MHQAGLDRKEAALVELLVTEGGYISHWSHLHIVNGAASWSATGLPVLVL